MAFDISRRFILGGAIGAGMAGMSGATGLLGKANAEAAFPPEGGLMDTPLLGPAEGMAQLSRNENPYGPSDSALKMIEYAGKKGAYYATEANMVLAKLIAERHGVSPEQIVITTGSGEALCAIALVYGPKGPIVAPRLFWDTTALYAVNMNMAEIDRVALTPEMKVDLAAIEAKVSESTGLVQLCNPNNPTGLVADPAEMKAAVKRMAAKTTVLVDEAYMELANDPDGNSCIDLIKEGHNVIVSRTFSKIYGMAGIRVGYTISSPEIAATLRSTAMSWISGVGLAAAIGCYNDTKFIDYSKGKIVEAREMVQATADTLGLVTLPSQTNFVYFKSGLPANDLSAKLLTKQIEIRGQYMDYTDWSRVSMGKIEDVERFCKALPEAIGA